MSQSVINEHVEVPVNDAALFYKTLLENGSDGICLLDASGNVKYCMSSVSRILGYEPTSRIGDGFFSLMHPEDARKHGSSMQQLIASTGNTIKFSARFLHHNGGWKWLDISAVNMLDNSLVEGIFVNYRDVTDSVALSKALEESETRYKNLASASPVGIFRTNAQGEAIYVNEKYCELSGLRPEDCLGDGWIKSLHPDDVAKIWKEWEEAFVTKRVFGMEHRIVTPKGKLKWVYCQTVPERDENNAVIGYVGTVTDITDRVLAEKALQQSEEQYRSLIENSFDGITVISIDGIVKYHSPSLMRILGYRPESGIGKSIIELLHPDDVNVFVSAQKYLQKNNGKNFNATVRFRHKNETWVTLEIRAINLIDKPGVEGLLINYRDITESKVMEKALRQSEERYRNMVENTQETIFVIDAETDKIVDFNGNAVKLFGYKRAQLLKMRVSDLSPVVQPDGKSSIVKGMEIAHEVLSKGKGFFEWVHLKANGKTFLSEVYLSRFPPLDRKLLRGTVVDVTAKKELEKKLLQQELQYRHLASVSPVGIFRTDVRERTTYVNEKWCAIAGIPESKAIGIGWMKSIHPDDQPRVRKDWNLSLRKKKISHIEFRFLTPEGKINWVLGEAVPDYDQRGNFIGFAGSITDITERVKAEQALAQIEQRNSALLAAVPDLLFRVSKDGTFLDFKSAADFAPLFPPEVFLGKKIPDLMPPQIAQPAMKLIGKALKTQQIQSFGYHLPDEKSEKDFFYEARIAPYVKDEVLVLIRDFTKQNEAEISLRTSEERWRSLVKSAPQYIATIDKNNRITFINYLRIMKHKQVIGKTVFELLKTASAKKRDLKKLMDNARKGIKGSIEFSIMNPKGELMWFNVKAASVKAIGKADELIVMALDITERKRAEEELMRSHEKLQALYQRLDTIREEEKKNIAMEIHDELGQELTAIKLGMFWLQQYFDRQNDGMDIGQVRQKIKSLVELSTQTINSARRLAHQLRPIVLDNLGLIPAIEWQVEKLNESGNIKCFFHHNIMNRKFSKEFSVALFRIIQESLTNMLRHSRADKASVDLHVQRKNLELSIEDNGIGIKPGDMKKPGKIGIFGMKERIQSWNGKFDLSGKPGKGTRLRIVFPLKLVLGAGC